PNPEFSGNDTFTYTVNDDDGAPSNEATVTIDVGGLNDPPVAVDDQAVTNRDDSIDLSVAANDTDVDGTVDPLTVAPTAALNGTIAVLGNGLVRYTPTPGFLGNDTFTYTVRDDLGAVSNVATVTVKVNNFPFAANDNAFTHEGSPVAIQVLTNDSDSDGVLDATSLRIVDAPPNGSAAINPNTGEVIYTPGGSFSGSDSFTYMVNDNDGATSNAATVSVEVNDIPVAAGDVAFTNANNSVTVEVALNDSDPDGTVDLTTVTISSAPENGSATVDSPSGRVTYTPNLNFFGSDTFTYTIQDNDGGVSQPGIVNVQVNAFPVAIDDDVAALEDTPVDIAVTSNDIDQDGTIDSSTLTIVSDPSNGTASVNASGMIQYTPSTNFFGLDSLSYTVRDEKAALSNEATVVLTVSEINDPPVAIDDATATGEETSVTVDVAANDTDIDGTVDPTSITAITPPLNGNLVVNIVSGDVTYTPGQDFEGTDTFTYTVKDEDGDESNAATVTITVSGENDPPVAIDDIATTNEDNPVQISVASNDGDIDGVLDLSSIVIVAPPSNGAALVDGSTGRIIYSPLLNFFGSDSLTYTIRDDIGLTSNVATVTITVSDVNDPPIASDDTAATSEETTVTHIVTANDSDIDGNVDVTTVKILESPSNGTAVTDETTGEISYTPNQDFVGVDSLKYTVKDDDGGESNRATLTITVSGVNDPPVAADDLAITNQDVVVKVNVISNDIDVDGTIDSTTVAIVSAPQNGSVSVNAATGIISYSPSEDFFGSDFFTYTVRDDAGLISNAATVTVTIVDVNDPPIAVRDSTSTTEETAVTIDVLSNDTDKDGTIDPTTLTVVTQPASGTATIVDNGKISYLPVPDFEGTDSFTYSLADDDGDVSNAATVTLTVLGTDDPPVAVNDDVTADEDVPAEIDVVSNDVEKDAGDAIAPGTVTIVSAPANGTAFISGAPGSITYSPRSDFFGTDSFTYTVNDNTGLTSNVATVSIIVNSVNDAPVAQNDLSFTGHATPVTINVLENDSGTDGIIDPTTVNVTVAPFSGVTSIDPVTGVITYTPNAGFSGTDGFLYTVDDNNGLSSNPATVNINVSGQLLPTHDSFVRSNETRPKGSGDVLRVREALGGVKQYAFLKFNVSGLPASVLSAKLRLFVSNGSDQGGDVHLVSNDFLGTNTPWDEAGLIFDNAPEIDGTPKVATIGPVVVGQTVEIDLTSTITGNGVYSFGIRNESDDAVEYSTREQANPPELIIETKSLSPLLPAIAGLNPSSGTVGTEVTITGANFGTTTEVSFNGLSTPSFTIVSESELIAVVPNGATSGRILVSNQEGQNISPDNFTVFLSPRISSISPLSGPVGSEITIFGSNFGGVNEITFGGTVAPSFTVNSTSELRVLVPNEAVNGPIGISNAAGAAVSSVAFTLVELPSITSLSPTSGPVNTEVTISGTNFVELFSVEFNGTPAVSFDVDSENQLRTIVPVGATSGRLSVRNTAGTAVSTEDFELKAAPSVTFFTPAGGLSSTEVTITGSHFSDVSDVTFGGVSAEFNIDSDTQLRATVPNGAISGPISLTNSLGTTASENSFVVTGLPTVTSFSPLTGTVGTEVTITGSAFSNVSSVSFSGSFASSFNIDSDAQIRAVVPAGAASGKIRLTNVAGDGESLANFIVTAGPSSLSFNPTDDSFVRSNRATTNYGDGDVLRSRKAKAAQQFSYLKFNVSGITSSIETAKLRLFVVTGSDDGGSVFSSSINFLGSNDPWNESELTFANAPEIDNTVLSSTASVFPGQTVEFDVTSAITGNGVFSFALRNNSDDAVEYSPKEFGNAPELVIELASGSSENVPIITAFSPAGGVPGTEVTVTGSNLLGTTDVFFSSISAASFSVDHDGQIRAIVGAGSSSGRVGVTSSEGTALSSTDFIIVSAPTINFFSPTSGPAGGEVTLTGNNFTGITEVRFAGTLAFDFVVESDTRLRVTVPVGAGVGLISVTNGAGTAVSSGNFTVIAPPVVSNFAPTSGAAGTRVTVTGSNLSSITGVFFNGVASPSFQIDSENQITASVPAGATTGAVSVTNAAGTAVSSQSFEVLGPPLITSFTPAGGLSGTEITILGTNFNNATGAAFNGLPAANFQIDSPTQVRATVPAGANSGPISVTNSIGTSVSSTNFVVAPSPIISAFNPLSGSAGTEVTITGSNLDNASAVQFGGTSALSFNVDSGFQIRATVPVGARSGKIRVNNISGSGESLANFIIASGPSTLTFNATDDAYVRSKRENDNFGTGTVLRLRKTASNVQESYIKFNLTGLTGIVDRARLRLFVADGGAQGGSIFVVSDEWDEDSITFNNAPGIAGTLLTTLGGVSTGQTIELDVSSAINGNGTISFGLKNESDDAVEYASSDVSNGPQLIVDMTGGTSANAPVVTTFSPAAGVVGTQVTISGNNFLGTTDVFFNNISASSFEVDNNTQIRAVVGPGSTTGKVGVISLEGTGLSATNFVMVGPPVITSFSPTAGSVGSEVTLFGSNFSGTLGVRFNGIFASSFTVVSDTELRAVVPSSATSGSIGVENTAGASVSSGNFTVTLPPSVTSFIPTSGPIGTVVTISGNNFSSLIGVSFNGVPASSFNVDSPTQLRATVPALGSTGPISVTNAAGASASTLGFEVLGPPVVNSFAPAGGLAGAEVTITGGNFDTVTGVAFNGLPAAIFTVISASEIRATVPGGASTGTIRVTNDIGTATSSTEFVVAALPTVTSINPLTGTPGTEVTITGSNFLNSLGVDFGITPA
ncbi:tandem-95 repeat protein, partial [bacterium]|nr:tandem-95 repeat protein [bacterium]